MRKRTVLTDSQQSAIRVALHFEINRLEHLEKKGTVKPDSPTSKRRAETERILFEMYHSDIILEKESQ
jgi:hypothetical protein